MYMMGIEGAGKVEEVEGESNGQLKEDYRVHDGKYSLYIFVCGVCTCVCVSVCACVCVFVSEYPM